MLRMTLTTRFEARGYEKYDEQTNDLKKILHSSTDVGQVQNRYSQVLRKNERETVHKGFSIFLKATDVIKLIVSEEILVQ